MKYAVIADIHGNMPALRAVLEDARQQGAQAWLLAGDYCVSAPWFNKVVSCIRSLPDEPDAQFAVSRWVGRSMCAQDIDWLDKLRCKTA